MSTVNVSNITAANAARMVEALVSLGAGEIIENTLKKLMHYQLSKYNQNMSQIRKELEPFEKKYHMSTQSFYKDFEDGKLGDEEDFFEWSSLYENILLYEDRINKLETPSK